MQFWLFLGVEKKILLLDIAYVAMRVWCVNDTIVPIIIVFPLVIIDTDMTKRVRHTT